MINIVRKKLFDKAIIVQDNIIQIVKVRDESVTALETEVGFLQKEDAKVYVDTDGGLTYLFNMDLPAKVEAEKLRDLRRSVALKRVFEYNTSDGKIDWAKVMPWAIAVLLILFK